MELLNIYFDVIIFLLVIAKTTNGQFNGQPQPFFRQQPFNGQQPFNAQPPFNGQQSFNGQQPFNGQQQPINYIPAPKVTPGGFSAEDLIKDPLGIINKLVGPQNDPFNKPQNFGPNPPLDSRPNPYPPPNYGSNPLAPPDYGSNPSTPPNFGPNRFSPQDNTPNVFKNPFESQNPNLNPFPPQNPMTNPLPPQDPITNPFPSQDPITNPFAPLKPKPKPFVPWNPQTNPLPWWKPRNNPFARRNFEPTPSPPQNGPQNPIFNPFARRNFEPTPSPPQNGPDNPIFNPFNPPTLNGPQNSNSNPFFPFTPSLISQQNLNPAPFIPPSTDSAPFMPPSTDPAPFVPPSTDSQDYIPNPFNPQDSEPSSSLPQETDSNGPMDSDSTIVSPQSTDWPHDVSDSGTQDASDSGPQDASDSGPQDASDSGPQYASDSGLQDASDSGPQDESDSGPQDASDSDSQVSPLAAPQPSPELTDTSGGPREDHRISGTRGIGRRIFPSFLRPGRRRPFPRRRRKDSLGRFRIVCLFNNLHYFRGEFTPGLLNPHLCTHLNYEFAKLDPKTYEIMVGEPELDIEMDFYQEAIDLKKVNRRLKVLLSLGGWNDSTKKYSELAAAKDKWPNFISQCINFLKAHEFDGLDFAWEYPNCWQGAIGVNPKDKQNFVNLLKAMYKEFKRHRLLLSVSVGAIKREIEAAYDVEAISNTVDYINVMTYDMHGPWEPVTGHHTQFSAKEDDAEPDANVKSGLQTWIDKGADKTKLNMGIAMYGRTYTMASPDVCELGVPAIGIGKPGNFSKEGGFQLYNEICYNLNNEGWIEKEDKESGFYACKGDQLVCYDNTMMMVKKTKWVVETGLGGILVKDLSGEDYEGKCYNMTFPLLRMAKMEMIQCINRLGL